jgi:hypothetical protein
MIVHLASRMLPGLDSLKEPARARWLWDRLRAGFPGALAAALMPGHLHLVVAVEVVGRPRRRLARTLGWWSRRYPIAKGFRQWEPPGAPRVIADRKHLRRTFRYVALNPCRDGLTGDPLSWIWSTHRDVCGALADPWVSTERVAAALGEGSRGFARRWHAYVSGDPSVRVEGTPFPVAEPTRSVPVRSVEDIAEAACAATRAVGYEALWRPGATRDLFVALCLAQGWRDTTILCRVLRVHRRTTQRLVRAAGSVPGEHLRAGLLCLGDPRLLGSQRRNVSRGATVPGSEGPQMAWMSSGATGSWAERGDRGSVAGCVAGGDGAGV